MPVRATPSTPVTISTTLDFSGPVPQGTFVASAPLCPSGAAVDNILSVIGSSQPPVFIAHVRRRLTCADGSGTITLQFTVQLPRELTGSQPCSILDGTGTFSTLRGTGSLSLPAETPGTDLFTGTVHFD
jgi:hypothetical protein